MPSYGSETHFKVNFLINLNLKEFIMFKNIFGLAILCLVFNLAKAEYIRAKSSSIKAGDIDLKAETDFELIISPEFSKLVNILSYNGKLELDEFITKAKNLIFDNHELIELINKNYHLYSSYKNFVHRKPRINFVLSVGEENAFDIVPNKNNSNQNLDHFIQNLSQDELKQLDNAKSEFEAILDSKAQLFFAEINKSELNKELKEKSGNKMFRASVIFS